MRILYGSDKGDCFKMNANSIALAVCSLIVFQGCSVYEGIGSTCVLDCVHATYADKGMISIDEHYDVFVAEDDLMYSIHGCDLKKHPECSWILHHEACKWGYCLFVNKTTLARFRAEIDRDRLILQKVGDRNLGVDPIVVPLQESHEKMRDAQIGEL